MEEKIDTIVVDKLAWYEESWRGELYRDGQSAYDNPVHIEGNKINIDGPVTIEFDEYYTTIETEMEVTISYVEREYEGETYPDDHVLESVEVLE